MVAHTLAQSGLELMAYTLKFYEGVHKGTGGPVTLSAKDGTV